MAGDLEGQASAFWGFAATLYARPGVAWILRGSGHSLSAGRERLRARNRKARLAGIDVTVVYRADVVILTGSRDDAWVRLAVRPSGTEPKVKGYIEVAIRATQDLAGARGYAEDLRAAGQREATAFVQRGPN